MIININLIKLIKENDNAVYNYKTFVERCESHLNTKDEYKKDEFEMQLKELNLEKEYNFSLKPSTILTIISNWKKSTKFTKYSSIDNSITVYLNIIKIKKNISTIMESKKI